MPKQHAEVLEILLCEIADDREVNGVVGEALGVFGQAELFEPLPNLLHRNPTDLPRPNRLGTRAMRVSEKIGREMQSRFNISGLGRRTARSFGSHEAFLGLAPIVFCFGRHSRMPSYGVARLLPHSSQCEPLYCELRERRVGRPRCVQTDVIPATVTRPSVCHDAVRGLSIGRDWAGITLRTGAAMRKDVRMLGTR